MRIEFDPAKSERNARERALPFDRVLDFDWAGAVYAEDTRRVYPERRFVAVGALDGRLHVVCFAAIADGVRIISLRKANAREVKAHGQATSSGE